jgi:drug/metabolite transporter (DMT)-like permease
MPNDSRHFIQLLAGAFLISTAAVWVRLAEVAPTVSGFYRMSIGGCVLLIIALLKKDKLWVNFLYFSKLFFVGFLFALDLYFWHRSILSIGPGLATVLANFQVFIMAFVGFVFFKEVFRWSFLAGLICSTIGLYLMVGIQWPEFTHEYQLGVQLGLATALAYSSFLLTLRHVESLSQRLSTTANLSIISLSTALILSLVMYWEQQSYAIPNLKTFWALIALGLIPQVIAWFLISKSMPHLPASITGTILLLQPALSMVWDVLFFGRSLVALELGGLVLVLSGVFIATLKR